MPQLPLLLFDRGTRNLLEQVRASDGAVTDALEVGHDFVHLSRNTGVAACGDRLAVLGLHSQTIHLHQARTAVQIQLTVVQMIVQKRVVLTMARRLWDSVLGRTGTGGTGGFVRTLPASSWYASYWS